MRTVTAVLVAVALAACGGGGKSGATKKPVAAKKGAKGGAKAGSGSSSVGEGSGSAPAPLADVERADSPAPTVREYSPDRKLPAVTGAAGYKALGKPRIVRIAIDTWPGWAPLVLANEGGAPKKLWKDGKKGEFQVEIVVIDDPVTLTDTILAGTVHAAWASADMLPLMIQRLQRDPRAMPRIYQQVDWSNGGHAIVARDAVKSVADLRGKSVVVPQNSPGHYFLLDQLLGAGVAPSEVNFVFKRDIAQAIAAYNGDRKTAAIAAWSPELYNLTRTGGNKVLVGTQTANKLIAHVWFARADFARDSPEIVEGLARGMLVAVEQLKSDDNRLAATKSLDTLMKLAPGTSASMLADTHWANFADNRAFLLERTDPTNFEHSYGNAVAVFRGLRVVEKVPDFDQLADFSVIKKLGKDAAIGAQKASYDAHYAAPAELAIEDGALVRTMRVQFAPGSADINKKVQRETGEVPYDPNAEAAIETIARIAAQTPNARIVIGGHVDASNKGRADEAAAKELATTRATAVREILVGKYSLDPSQMVITGYGWDKPADPNDADNHARNRRVDMKVVRSAP